MNSLSAFFQAVGLGLVLLLPLANPLTTVALLLGLAGNMPRDVLRQLARRTSVYTFCIMVVAFYAGQWVMNTFGISLPGLRIAGGGIVAFIGFHMLFPPPDGETAVNAEDQAGGGRQNADVNIAFVPLAMPATAGPGTIAMIISTASSFHNNPYHLAAWVMMSAPVATFAVIAVILWLCLRSAGAIMRLTGKGGIEAISRLMGFLLVCMGVQFIINGILVLVSGAAAM